MRELGTIDATMIVVGSMIGSGIFITSAESARLVGTPGWLLAAWAISGVMTVSGSVAAAEIAAMMPRAGGQYVFLRDAYRPIFGFLFGWAMFLVVQTGTIAAVAVAFAKFLGVFLPWVSADSYAVAPIRLGNYAVSLSTQQIVAVALILCLTAVNTRGLNLGKWIQNTFTFTKTAALFGLIVLGLLLGSNFGSAAWAASWWYPTANGWSRGHGLSRSGDRGGYRPLALAGPGDDRAFVLAVGLEQRDFYRRRDPRARPHPAARDDSGHDERGSSLPPRQCGLHRDPQIP